MSSTNKTTIIIFGLGAILFFGGRAYLDGRPTKPRASATTAPRAKFGDVDRSAQAQSGRLDFMGKLGDLGVIYKLEMPGRYPHVYVGPAWESLSIDDKKSFISVVAAYYYVKNAESDIVVLKDYRDGKDVGRFDQYGLHLE